MRLLIIGPPGSGKGTQAAILTNKLNIPHISTGEMFRQAIKMGTKLGIIAESFINKGELVPDEITIELVKERLCQEDCQNGYLLDGFPRTLEQGDALDKVLKDMNHNLDKVIYLDVPIESIIRRLTARRICDTCNAVYHIECKKPKVDNICDQCGNSLVTREDDKEETVRHRMEVYERVTSPLVAFYEKKNLLCRVSGEITIEKTTALIGDCLGRDLN